MLCVQVGAEKAANAVGAAVEEPVAYDVEVLTGVSEDPAFPTVRCHTTNPAICCDEAVKRYTCTAHMSMGCTPRCILKLIQGSFCQDTVLQRMWLE